MKFKKYALLVLAFPVFFILFFAAYDPYGVLWRCEPILFASNDMRIMDAAAINSGKFDSYILGSSMLLNTSAREAEALFNDGSRFANISMEGGSFFERAEVFLRYIYENGGAKNIIYSLDHSYIWQDRMGGRSLGEYAYLYDNSRLNNLKVYFSMTVIEAIGKQAVMRENFSEGIYKDYDMPSNWFIVDPEQPKLFGGISNWYTTEIMSPVTRIGLRRGALEIISAAARTDITPLAEARFSDEDLARIDLAKEYCNEYVIRFVEENPSTQFYMLFPPYSRIRFAIWYQCDKVSALIHQQIVRYFAEMGARYPNLHVFGFENEAFIDDIALYKDTTHYHPSVNSLMLAAMSAGTNKITPQNVDEYLSVSEALALSFDLKGLAEEISEYLAIDR